jgi:hypothetical protein
MRRVAQHPGNVEVLVVRKDGVRDGPGSAKQRFTLHRARETPFS